MLKGLIILIVMLFLLSDISALCSEGQIDINSASLSELDKIVWIGNSTANKIIIYRQDNTFDSIDELINISGIGKTKLSDIKSEGLACVSSENQNQEETTENETPVESVENEVHNQTVAQQTSSQIPDSHSEKPQINPSTPPSTETEINLTDNIDKPITADVIELNPANPKDIKSNENVLTSDNIAVYGLVAFCILLTFLFAISKIKKQKTEFVKP